MRVPHIDSQTRERATLVFKLEADLERFSKIPPHRRESECADEGEQTCKALLRELGIKDV
jgi:hypothetical protein